MAGKFFHTINSDGVIQYQGHVLRDENGKYFVRFFSFMDGRPTNSRYLTASETQTARFYDTNADMLDAYYRAYPDLDRDLAEFAASDLDDDD